MNKEDKAELEEWIKCARSIELDLAKKNLKNGQDPEIVLKELSHRLIQKVLHPLIKYTELLHTGNYNSYASQEEYKEYMKLKNIGLKADHVTKD